MFSWSLRRSRLHCAIMSAAAARNLASVLFLAFLVSACGAWPGSSETEFESVSFEPDDSAFVEDEEDYQFRTGSTLDGHVDQLAQDDGNSFLESDFDAWDESAFVERDAKFLFQTEEEEAEESDFNSELVYAHAGQEEEEESDFIEADGLDISQESTFVEDAEYDEDEEDEFLQANQDHVYASNFAQKGPIRKTIPPRRAVARTPPRRTVTPARRASTTTGRPRTGI